MLVFALLRDLCAIGILCATSLSTSTGAVWPWCSAFLLALVSSLTVGAKAVMLDRASLSQGPWFPLVLAVVFVSGWVEAGIAVQIRKRQIRLAPSSEFLVGSLPGRSVVSVASSPIIPKPRPAVRPSSSRSPLMSVLVNNHNKAVLNPVVSKKDVGGTGSGNRATANAAQSPPPPPQPHHHQQAEDENVSHGHRSRSSIGRSVNSSNRLSIDSVGSGTGTSILSEDARDIVSRAMGGINDSEIADDDDASAEN